MAIRVTPILNRKDNNPLINFYNDNSDNIVTYKKQNGDNITICSYNVHGWVNINENIDFKVNFINIKKILLDINADILILQEVCYRDTITENYVVGEFASLGYDDYFVVKNGGCYFKKYSTDYIIVFTRNKMDLKDDIDVTDFIYKRHCPVFIYEDIKILGVHLEIGKRYHHLKENSEIRKQIVNNNTKIRMGQLGKILAKHADINIIVGDFNFTPDDVEFEWLSNLEFMYHGNYNNTTPYNKTDMIFLNKNIDHIAYDVIKTNYSDHLPIIHEISKKNNTQ